MIYFDWEALYIIVHCENELSPTYKVRRVNQHELISSG